jgi:hypothetical protein
MDEVPGAMFNRKEARLMAGVLIPRLKPRVSEPLVIMNCKPDGEYADFENYPFLNAMHRGMELAINLNFPAHPKLMEFLEKMSEQGVFVNATVSQFTHD